MAIKIALAILLALPSAAAAQEKLAEQLRKAIVEEEVNQKLDKAIQEYTKILAQYDEDRKVAATALFHFAECCRKLGQKDQAIAAYERVIRDFADQRQLTEASRNQLTSTYGVHGSQEKTTQLKRQQELLQQEMMLVQEQIDSAEKKIAAGNAGAREDLITSTKELLELQIRLAELRAGVDDTAKQQQFLAQTIMLVESQIAEAQRKVDLGLIAPNDHEMIALKEKLLDLKMRMEGPVAIPKRPVKK